MENLLLFIKMRKLLQQIGCIAVRMGLFCGGCRRYELFAEEGGGGEGNRETKTNLG